MTYIINLQRIISSEFVQIILELYILKLIKSAENKTVYEIELEGGSTGELTNAGDIKEQGEDEEE